MMKWNDWMQWICWPPPFQCNPFWLLFEVQHKNGKEGEEGERKSIVCVYLEMKKMGEKEKKKKKDKDKLRSLPLNHSLNISPPVISSSCLSLHPKDYKVKANGCNFISSSETKQKLPSPVSTSPRLIFSSAFFRLSPLPYFLIPFPICFFSISFFFTPSNITFTAASTLLPPSLPNTTLVISILMYLVNIRRRKE